MLILGDIGNSVTKLFLVNPKDKILKKISLPSKSITNSILNKKFKILTKDFKNIEKILFCSVVPKTFNSIKRFISKKTKVKCYEIKDLNLKSILNIKANFKQVGSDRLANAISLMSPKKNFIILDFGTATTFDVLANNTYRGGVIAPGISISLNTLTDKASLIPKINLKKIKKVIGIDTNSAVRSGFFWGYAGLIDNMIKLIKKQTKSEFKIILTGGLADLYKNSINAKCKVDRDLTIKGIIKITKNLL